VLAHTVADPVPDPWIEATRKPPSNPIQSITCHNPPTTDPNPVHGPRKIQSNTAVQYKQHSPHSITVGHLGWEKTRQQSPSLRSEVCSDGDGDRPSGKTDRSAGTSTPRGCVYRYVYVHPHTRNAAQITHWNHRRNATSSNSGGPGGNYLLGFVLQKQQQQQR
jgi:hypothetical protein